MLDQDDKKAEEQKSIKCTCIQEDQLKLESINAFKFNFSLLSMQVRLTIFYVHFISFIQLVNFLLDEANYNS